MTPDADRLPPAYRRNFADPFPGFIDQLRTEDPAFAEASVLYDDDMGEWQAAVYLLTGCEPVWRELGAAVMAERSMVPVIGEIENPRRPWSGSQDEAMAWAAHFWDLHRHSASFPFVFERHYFERWITALYLRCGRVPASP